MSLGDFDLSTVIDFKFTTFRPSTGAPFTLAGTPAISVYKDNGTTQTTTGVTLTVDFDSVTGLNHVRIDTSADGTFYSSGSFFDVVITAGTVDSVSAVGAVVGRFTIRKTADLKPTTAGRTLDVSSTGEAGIDWANVGSPTTSLNLSGTTISSSQAVASVSGNVGGNVAGSVGSISGVSFPSNFALLGINASGHVSRVVLVDTTTTNTDMLTVSGIADAVWDEVLSGHLTAGSTGNALNAAGSAGDPWSTTLPGGYTGSQAGKILSDILVDTGTTLQSEVDDIQSRLPAALVGGRMDASVGSMAANVITSTSIATDAITDTKVAASAVTKIQTGLATPTNITGATGIVISGISLNAITTAVWGATTRRLTDGTNIVLAKGTGITGFNDPAAGDIADAVWDEILGGHVIAGSAAVVLGDGAADAGEAREKSSFIWDDLENGGRIDLLIDAIKATTDKLDTAMVLDGLVWQFTVNALELAPAGGGGGSTDWNADERTAIRAILGIPGSGTTPADPTTGILDTIRDLVVTVDNVADGIATQVGTAGNGLTSIPWNAAWDAEVQSECADALNAYDPPTNAEMEARTLAAASYGTAANQTTILARLGSWTGSGINTVLGAFRALMAKASALTPTDISSSTTYDNTTDSLEALRDRGDAAWITGAGGGGSSQAVIGSTNAITRNINEELPIQFTWNSASATITGTVEIGTASAVALQGAVTFVRTDAGGKHWYQLAYDADDRPTVAGLARYVFTDGTDYLTVPVQFTEVAGGAGSGTGARTITVTVNDGSNPIQNALVRLTLGAETFINTTNVSGQCTLNVNDGTWTVSITSAGFSFAGATLVVDGNETVTYSMAAVTPPVAAGPGLCTVRFTFYENDGTTPIQNVVVSAALDQNVAVANSILSNAIQYGTSNALGIVDLVLVQGASIKRGNKAYKIQASDPQSSSSLPLLDFRAVIPTVSTINASSLVPLEGRR